MYPPDAQPEEEIFLFTTPCLKCQKCFVEIPLPYGELPRISLDQALCREAEFQTTLPPGGWTITVGCFACGYVGNYDSTAVDEYTGRLGEARRYHDAASFFCVTFVCANMRCKSPAKLYAHVESGGASVYLRMLKEGLFQGSLPCGHGVLPGPPGYGQPERIVGPLW